MTRLFELAKFALGVGQLLMHGEAFMASIKIKIAREGLVAAAHRNASPGLTSGGSIVYQINNVPDGVNADQLVSVLKGYDAPKDRFELQYSELPAGQ